MLIGAGALLAFGLGIIGFSVGGVRGVFNPAYQSLQLFFLEFTTPPGGVPVPLQIARFAAPLLTVALTADAIRALVVYVRDGGVGPFRRRDHTVICGLGRTGAAIALAARSGAPHERTSVIAITREGHAERVRQCRRRGVRVIKGDATDPEVLAQAYAHRAARLVIVCSDDRVNADVLGAVIELRHGPKRSVGRLAVHLQVSERLLARTLEPSPRRAAAPDDGLEVHLFDLPQRVAKTMVQRAREDPSNAERTSVDRRSGVVIVGFGTLGQAVAVEALTTFRNSAEGVDLHVIDRDAKRKCEAFTTRERLPPDTAVIDHPDEVESRMFAEAAFIDGRTRAVFICPNDDPLAIAAGLQLARLTSAPVIVRLAKEGGGLTRVVPENSKLSFVGMDQLAPSAIFDHPTGRRRAG